MPFTVQQLIESYQEPVTVSPGDPAQKALALMVEHDFSQLPVVDENNKPFGIVSGDSIICALNNFGIPLGGFMYRTRLSRCQCPVKCGASSKGESMYDNWIE